MSSEAVHVDKCPGLKWDCMQMLLNSKTVMEVQSTQIVWFCPSPTCISYKNDLMAVPLAVAGFVTRTLLEEGEHLCLQTHPPIQPNTASASGSTIPPKQHIPAGLQRGRKFPPCFTVPFFTASHSTCRQKSLHTFSKGLPRIVIIGSQFKNGEQVK